MFGLRATSASHGQGHPLANVPIALPGQNGGFNNPSVHNTSVDLVTNDIPSTFLIPSSHPVLKTHDNEFNDGDFVFTLSTDVSTQFNIKSYAAEYRLKRTQEVNVVTLPKLNALLQAAAKDAHNTGKADALGWFQSPELVSRWASPFGAVLNKMKVNGGTTTDPKYGLNVCVSRRANIKNNFWTVKHAAAPGWFAQSTMQAAVQYSLEKCKFGEEGAFTPVVVVSMVLLDHDMNDDGIHRISGTSAKGDKSLELTTQTANISNAGNIVDFCQMPLSQNARVLPIGRVLNSPMVSPTQYTFIRSLFSKKDYDSLKPIEIELGCQ